MCGPAENRTGDNQPESRLQGFRRSMRDLGQDPGCKPPWRAFTVGGRIFSTMRRDCARAGCMHGKTRFLRIAQVGNLVYKSEKIPGN
ncbi:MAG: hypothetical protein CVV32_12675 [Methanomicrobiales archaeon HGW-Methanomicrobiales-3]|nr:MAG: hypothetical protein CVV32_12675 [Methanomicrobiales archaeon HGW-Methanomicrobiales-3]